MTTQKETQKELEMKIDNKENRHTINVIYTYRDREQQTMDWYVLKGGLKNMDKNEFIEIMIEGVLNKKEFQSLEKISTCVYGIDDYKKELPKWYVLDNGKFYRNEGDFQSMEHLYLPN